MPQINSNYLLIILGILAILVELAIGVATGFDLLIIGVTLIISGLIGILTNSLQIAFIATSVILIIYFLIVRNMIKKGLSIKTHKTSVDNLIGKNAIVTKDISPHNPGQIKVEGEIWRAEANSKIDPGKTVIIESVSGVTLFVTQKES